MTVKKLIEYLQQKNPDAQVRFAAEEAITNRSYKVMAGRNHKWEEDPASIVFNVDDICETGDGKTVYLSEGWSDEDDKA